jgi:hypothetical protein
MGITDFSLTLLNKYLPTVENKTVMELGSQNLYCSRYPDYPYADKYYNKQGFHYSCIDLNGENLALVLDLAKPQKVGVFGVVTDFGTSEHVGIDGKHDPRAFYNCWLNKHNMCEVGGLIISENPKTGNWLGHGFNYVTEDFYKELAEANGYELLELGEHPAMGNTTDGWNIYCVLRKTSDKFMTYQKFKTLSFKTS